ncbi:ABC transporter ATP-binding protein [Bifidobacterium lemurum]|uniref:ABC transporter ATP-binding protein n=1 Tax=Bifidobacterium lemurum TaxID=1603886 RepID=A0A261FT99_9BIFI|nr:ATP-binding cassette domain-containing protein [Bifidobacterium lemurum]OZG62173.1 ABC transporter ATP-binding protein [Bifidobacterium lemurum]QOL33550.1 ATP-binding cassette domain-containing protein [Bifidobacterium lemurum]
MASCIEIRNLTHDYGAGRGVFDVSLDVQDGECFGFAGINGAGKTTTIRHLMGFLKPDSGTAAIRGRDCWRDACEIKRSVGYVPGEIAFPAVGTGNDFLDLQMERARTHDRAYRDYVCDALQLDPTAGLKAMSKGMKQKTALAAAFMAKPDILIMDEPTTGLDPLMRDRFLELLDERLKAGCTVFMSSHIFGEMERSCDRVALIKDGHIADVKDVNEIRHNHHKEFRVEFATREEYERARALGFELAEERPERLQITFGVDDGDIALLLNALMEFDVLWFKEIKHSLEEYVLTVFEAEEAGKADDADGTDTTDALR